MALPPAAPAPAPAPAPDAIRLERCPDLALHSATPKGTSTPPLTPHSTSTNRDAGRGVFATAPIPSGTIIDTCPVLVLGPAETKQHLQRTALHHYTYNWPAADPAQQRHGCPQAVIFGLGSMFNHSRDQNVGWRRDGPRRLITYRALRDIAAGEELCISYGDRLTFEDADAPGLESEQDPVAHLASIQI